MTFFGMETIIACIIGVFVFATIITGLVIVAMRNSNESKFILIYTLVSVWLISAFGVYIIFMSICR